MAENTIPKMFFKNVKTFGIKPVLRYKKGDVWLDINWIQFGDRVEKLAKGLLELGITPGDKVALLAENRPEWAITDLAIISIGAINIPIYPTNIPNQVWHILYNSEAKAIIVSNLAQLEKIFEVRDKLPNLKSIIIIDIPDGGVPPEAISFQDVTKTGSKSGRSKELEELIRKANPNDIVSFIYTSGTTGDPKGVMLTHRNFLSKT